MAMTIIWMGMVAAAMIYAALHGTGAALSGAVAAGADTVIEFGPGAVLTGLAKRTIPELKLFNINSVEALNAF